MRGCRTETSGALVIEKQTDGRDGNNKQKVQLLYVHKRRANQKSRHNALISLCNTSGVLQLSFTEGLTKAYFFHLTAFV